MGARGAAGFGGGRLPSVRETPSTYPRVCGIAAAYAASGLETHCELEWWPVVTGTGQGEEAWTGRVELGTPPPASQGSCGSGWGGLQRVPSKGRRPGLSRPQRSVRQAAPGEGVGLAAQGVMPGNRLGCWPPTDRLPGRPAGGISASVQQEGSLWTPLRSLPA